MRKGHPGDLRSLHERGDRTRVSQAATVNVHTKKYLCAERCGGRSRDGGRDAEGSAIAGPVAVAGVWEERNRDRERPGTRPACYELIQSDRAQTPKPAFFGHCHLDQPFRLFPSSSTPPSRSPHSRSPPPWPHHSAAAPTTRLGRPPQPTPCRRRRPPQRATELALHCIISVHTRSQAAVPSLMLLSCNTPALSLPEPCQDVHPGFILPIARPFSVFPALTVSPEARGSPHTNLANPLYPHRPSTVVLVILFPAFRLSAPPSTERSQNSPVCSSSASCGGVIDLQRGCLGQYVGNADKHSFPPNSLAHEPNQYRSCAGKSILDGQIRMVFM